MNKVLICILLLLNVTSKQHIFTQIDGDYKCVENLCNLKMTILSHRERYTYSIEKNGIYLNGTIPDNGFVMSKLTQFTLKLKNYDGIEMNGKINFNVLNCVLRDWYPKE